MEDYGSFWSALNFWVQKHGSGSQKRLHIDTGLSEPMISMILTKKKQAGLRSQIKIAQALGYTIEGFIEFGKSILDKGVPPSKAAYPENVYELPNTSKRLYINKNHTNEEHPFYDIYPTTSPDETPEEKFNAGCHEDLDVILKSENKKLIAAIAANLVSFREAIEVKRKNEEMEKKIEQIQRRLNVVENGA